MLKTGVRTLNGQTEDWSDALFQNFKIDFHLVCEEFIDMVSGRYRMG
jgi:hypothetical protein